MTKRKSYTIENAPKLDLSSMPPYGKQLEFIEHGARWKVVAFGRQSGKSWAARYCLLDRAINKNHRCWWVFPVYRTAKQHWNELLNLLERTGFPTKSINKSDMHIEFYGGGFITIRSADEPINLRGATLDFIVLDEAAFMTQDIWQAILQPMMTAARGDALLISTPNGQNWFYELYLLGQDDRYSNYASWTMASIDSPYQDRKTLLEIKETIHPLIWREEYMAEFLADSGGVFTGIEDAAKVAGYNIPTEKDIRTYYVGIDWGLDGDYTVFTVVCRETREQVYGERFTSIGTTSTVNRIVELMHLWQPSITFVEKNGIGEPLLALLKEKLSGYEGANDDLMPDTDSQGIFGGFRIRSIHMNNERKRDIVERLAVDIEWKRLAILAKKQDNLEIDLFAKAQISEFSTFKRDRTKTGLVTYGAAEGSHDDCVMALALAYSGMPKPPKFKKHWEKSAKPVKRRNPFKNRRSRKYA